MIRRFACLPLLLLATSAIAQQPQISAQERARLQRLGAALAACHGNIVRRDAPGRFTSAQIVDRALAGCATREAAIRAALVQHIGAAGRPRRCSSSESTGGRASQAWWRRHGRRTE